MPRTPREIGEYLHIITRGVGKQIVFEDESDRIKYLKLLQLYSVETNLSICAYCLMDNHVHLLVHCPLMNISEFMHKLGISYAMYYNRKYERVGHLFQSRFKSEVINGETHLLTVYRYILNNPMKAGICAADKYPWSSFREYGVQGGLTDTSVLSQMIGSQEMFREFMLMDNAEECMEADQPLHDDQWAITVIKETLGIASGTVLQRFSRKGRDEALALLKNKGISIRQLERLTGLNRGIIQRACVTGDRSR